LELEKIQCFTDAIRMKDCDGAGCTNVHYHITPHFWDANVDQLGIEMMPTWNGIDYTPASYNDGPIPCVDWCDDGKVPEWRGPCTTQPPSTGSSTVRPTPTASTGTTTSKSTISPDDCDANCYEQFFACMDVCSGDSVCSSDCSRIHFECVTNCHDPDYVPPTTTTTQEPTTTKSTSTTTKNPILICDNNCYEDHNRCVKNCRRHDEECIELCHIENTQCLAKCHDPDYVPPTTKPTTTTTTKSTTSTTTTTITTTTTEFDVAACDDACYDEYFKCLAACSYSVSDLPDIDQKDQCSTNCNNANFECMISCHEN